MPPDPEGGPATDLAFAISAAHAAVPVLKSRPPEELRPRTGEGWYAEAQRRERELPPSMGQASIQPLDERPLEALSKTRTRKDSRDEVEVKVMNEVAMSEPGKRFQVQAVEDIN